MENLLCYGFCKISPLPFSLNNILFHPVKGKNRIFQWLFCQLPQLPYKGDIAFANSIMKPIFIQLPHVIGQSIMLKKSKFFCFFV